MIALLSIKPEFASRIFNGTKKFEYRKAIFKRNVTRVVVYASAPVSMVIGEFTVEGILHDKLENLWQETQNQSGISEDFFYDYFSERSAGYAIIIGQTLQYSSPYRLQESLGLQPPQSFLYLSCPIKPNVNNLTFEL